MGTWSSCIVVGDDQVLPTFGLCVVASSVTANWAGCLAVVRSSAREPTVRRV